LVAEVVHHQQGAVAELSGSLCETGPPGAVGGLVGLHAETETPVTHRCVLRWSAESDLLRRIEWSDRTSLGSSVE
jgi:xanthine dehydrogenase iron-sulfur cluster and FAD-binding subunit A